MSGLHMAVESILVIVKCYLSPTKVELLQVNLHEGITKNFDLFPAHFIIPSFIMRAMKSSELSPICKINEFFIYDLLDP